MIRIRLIVMKTLSKSIFGIFFTFFIDVCGDYDMQSCSIDFLFTVSATLLVFILILLSLSINFDIISRVPLSVCLSPGRRLMKHDSGDVFLLSI